MANTAEIVAKSGENADVTFEEADAVGHLSGIGNRIIGLLPIAYCLLNFTVRLASKLNI